MTLQEKVVRLDELDDAINKHLAITYASYSDYLAATKELRVERTKVGREIRVLKTPSLYTQDDIGDLA